MLRRIEAEEALVERSQLAIANSRSTEPARVLSLETDCDTEPLPHGHPRWVRDGIAVSARARAVIARLKPVVSGVLRFWDHRLRTIVAAGRRVSIDASGSYRA